MYSVITWGTELLNQLGILQDRMSLFRIGSNNLLMIFSIYILKHSRFMKTFEHTAISKSIYMVNLKYMVYPACKMVSDLSEFFFVHFRFTSHSRPIKGFQCTANYCTVIMQLWSAVKKYCFLSLFFQWSLKVCATSKETNK